MDSTRPRLAPTLLLALAALAAGPSMAQRARRWTVVDTGQEERHGDAAGQDAHYLGNRPSYRDNGDGTVTDLQTGLEWQRTPDFVKRTLDEAEAYAGSLTLGRHRDWRLPTIKELVSIADFDGSIHSRTPYLDTSVFDFEYPDTSEGWREIDAQYWSSDRYLGRTMAGDRSAFGFNFADGRVKCYPLENRRGASVQYVRCVRGSVYGVNDLVDNGDGTITDRATGLTWTRADAGRAMDWEEALAYAENLTLAGRDDWRLPSVKELHSIVDVSRAPDATDRRARGPAIDPIFELTDDRSWFWSSTTHVENGWAYYVAFGRATSAREWRGEPMNAHGAGAVRSDPKTGDPSRWADGHGPQSDEIRIANHVRCVRGGVVRRVADAPAGRPSGPGPAGSFIGRLDTDGDGKVSRSEFDGPAHHFDRLDRDGDGSIDADEAPTGPPGGGRGR